MIISTNENLMFFVHEYPNDPWALFLVGGKRWSSLGKGQSKQSMLTPSVALQTQGTSLFVNRRYPPTQIRS